MTWIQSLRGRVTLVIVIALASGPAVTLADAVAVRRGAGAPGPGAMELWATAFVFVAMVSLAGWLLGAVVTRPLARDAARLSRAVSVGDWEAAAGEVQLAEVREVGTYAARLLQREQEAATGRIAYLAALIHDLKARLAGVSLLLDDPTGVDPEDAWLLRGELAAIQQWLARALDAIRLERVTGLVVREPVALAGLLREIVARVSAADERAVAMSVHGDAQVLGDRAELSRAMTNLVSNARKAARTSVAIEIFPGLVRVVDDGPGLPAPFEVLTRPFMRAESAGDQLTTTGTGIGLFVARRVLELHGGRLVCERTDQRGTVLLAYMGH